jgi:2-methylcitrate dehydratase PrpD
MPTIAERLADFALGTTPDDVPPEVLAQAARFVADTLYSKPIFENETYDDARR